MAADTKTALLNSAEMAARAHGYDGFSYADLAKDVGIRKASIHHHFPSKASLALALMERYRQDFKKTCEEIDDAQTTGGAKIKALIARYEAALEGGRSLCLCVSLSTSRESLRGDVVAQMRLFREMMIGWLTLAFQEAKTDGTIHGLYDPAQEARAALALLEGAQLSARAQEDPAFFQTSVALLLGRISD